MTKKIALLQTRLVIVPPFEHLPLSRQDLLYLSRFTTLINAEMSKLDHTYNCELWGHYEALQLMISRINVEKPFKIWIDQKPCHGPFGFLYKDKSLLSAGQTSLIPHFQQRQPIPQPLFKQWSFSIKDLAGEVALTLPKVPGSVVIQPTLYELRLFPFQASNILADHQVIVIGGYTGTRIYHFPINANSLYSVQVYSVQVYSVQVYWVQVPEMGLKVVPVGHCWIEQLAENWAGPGWPTRLANAPKHILLSCG